MKSMNITSATGRSPVSAAPLAAPTIADSVIGVSITRRRPNSAAKPAVTPKVPPAASPSPAVPPSPPTTSSPRMITVGSRRISWASASESASR